MCSHMPDSGIKKFTDNKPLFYGTLAALGIGAVLYYRHKQATATATPAATGSPADSGDPCDPNSTAYDPTLCAQQSPGFAGDPFGGGTFGQGGFTDTGGATGQTVNDLTTKEAWIQAAERILPNGGSPMVRNALLGVLGGLTVTQQERNIFLEAVGVLGDPPGGYPKPIKVSDTAGQPGSGKVPVPGVKGMQYDKAALVIQHAGLVPERATANVGIVETEEPPAGTRVLKGSIVRLGNKPKVRTA